MPTRIKDIANTVSTPLTDDFVPLDGASSGTRKMPLSNLQDTAGSLRSVPQNAQGGAYTLVASDNGKHIRAATTITVPSGVFGVGNAVSVVNYTAGSIAINASGVTLRLAGTGSTGNRALAQYGVATVLCIAANEFVVTGSGLS
jgi:hypothetical protein